MIRILHVDNDSYHSQLVRAQLLKLSKDIAIHNAETLAQLEKALQEELYDCILCDDQLPGNFAVNYIRKLHEQGNNTPCVVMTDDEIEQGERYSTGEFGNSDLTVRVNFGRFDLLSYWLHHLVDRYQQQQIKQQLQQNLLQKTPEELATMKKARENLTKREIEILDLIAAGESNQEIADKLGISYRTVVNHVYNIFNKLGIHSRAEAIHFAISTSIAHQQADKD